MPTAVLSTFKNTTVAMKEINVISREDSECIRVSADVQTPSLLRIFTKSVDPPCPSIKSASRVCNGMEHLSSVMKKIKHMRKNRRIFLTS
jgi:hypothetical protein